MRCGNCRKKMMPRQSQEIRDLDGFLRLKAWRCDTCGEVLEEIQIVPKAGKPASRRFRYAVRPWTIRQFALSSTASN